MMVMASSLHRSDWDCCAGDDWCVTDGAMVAGYNFIGIIDNNGIKHV